MTTDQMKYFLTVARCLSFTEAAEQLFLSQPALSRQISALERELDAPLFLRSKNTVRLTPAGQVLREGLEELYPRHQVLREAVAAAQAGRRGRLSIGLLEEQLLPASIREGLRLCAQRHPELQVRLSRHSFQNLRSGLLEGSLDLAVSLAIDLEDLPGVRSRVCEISPMYLVVEAHDPLASLESLTAGRAPELLANCRFILTSPEDSAPAARASLDFFRSYGFHPSFIHAPNAELLSLWVLAGQGAALLNGSHSLVHNPDVRFLPLPGLSPSQTSVAWLRDSPNPATARFLECLPPEP